MVRCKRDPRSLATVGLLLVLMAMPAMANSADDQSAYRQEQEYVGGYPMSSPVSSGQLCLDPAGSPIAVAGGCNFTCPTTTCRITVEDDLFGPAFRVCSPSIGCPARMYHESAVVAVGANQLFQVYLDAQGATHGHIIVTQP